MLIPTPCRGAVSVILCASAAGCAAGTDTAPHGGGTGGLIYAGGRNDTQTRAGGGNSVGGSAQAGAVRGGSAQAGAISGSGGSGMSGSTNVVGGSSSQGGTRGNRAQQGGTNGTAGGARAAGGASGVGASQAAGSGGTAGGNRGVGGNRSVGGSAGVASGGTDGLSGSGGATGVSGSSSMLSGFAVGVNTWYLAPTWGFGTPWANEATSTDFSWSDAFLSDLLPFASLRLMDWNATNYSNISSWSQRRLPNDAGNREIYIDADTKGAYSGLAYELQVDLCNRSGKLCWITLPMLADDDYFKQFALLIKDRLDPKLRLIVELSNEPDGFWFRQSDDAAAKGAELSLPGAAPYYQGAAFTTYRTLQMASILRGILSDRVIIARCGVGNTDLLRASLTSVYKSQRWNPSSEVIDMLCMSAYFGNGRDGASYTLEQARADIDALVDGGDGFVKLDDMRKQFGIRMFGVYEGGVHVLKNAGTFSQSTAAGAALSYLLDRAAPYFQVFNIYTDASTWPNSEGNGAWGLKQRIGGPETGKSTAVKTWIQTHAK